MRVAWLDSSSFSAACWATVGRWVMIGTRMDVPADGVGRRRVVSMNGRDASMTPRSSLMKASGTTPALSDVMSSATSRMCCSGMRSPVRIWNTVLVHSPKVTAGAAGPSVGSWNELRARSSTLASRSINGPSAPVMASLNWLRNSDRSTTLVTCTGSRSGAGSSSFAPAAGALSSATGASSLWSERTATTPAVA